MATVTVGAICTAIHLDMENLVTASGAGLRRVQNYDELTEGMNTLPTLQVYPENWETDVASDGTERSTFVDGSTGVPGHRQTELLVRLDLYARRRSQLDEDWGEAIDLADLIDTQLNEQGSCPFFDQTGIRAFSWTCTRVVFDYASVLYTGFRFELTIRIF
jgi:hypothetical protein